MKTKKLLVNSALVTLHSGPLATLRSGVLATLLWIGTSLAAAHAQNSPDATAPASPSPVAVGRPLGAITAIAFSPDGTKLAAGTFGQVVLYDTTTWQPIGVFRQVEDSVRALAFSPDGLSLAVGSGLPGRSGRVALWDMHSSKPRLYPPRQDTIEAIAFSKDGKELLFGANDNKACYYPANATDGGAILDDHNGRVQAVAFASKPGSVFVTGALDKLVKVWDEKQHKAVVNFDQSEAGITGLVGLPAGLQFVGASLDGKLRWWSVNYNESKNLYSGNILRVQDAHPNGVYALGISGNGAKLISTGADNVVQLWDAASGVKAQTFVDNPQPCYAVALSPDAKLAAAGGREGVVRVWDVPGKILAQTLIPPPLPVQQTTTPPTKLSSGNKKRK